jgi:hypothetical protein
VDFDDFLEDAEDWYAAHHNGEDFDEEQIEWMQIIYEEYADENGEIDWSDHSHDSAWYYYLTEVLDIDADQVDSYTED